MAAITRTASQADFSMLRHGAMIAYRWLVLGFLLAADIADFLYASPGEVRHESHRAAGGRCQRTDCLVSSSLTNRLGQIIYAAEPPVQAVLRGRQ